MRGEGGRYGAWRACVERERSQTDFIDLGLDSTLSTSPLSPSAFVDLTGALDEGELRVSGCSFMEGGAGTSTLETQPTRTSHHGPPTSRRTTFAHTSQLLEHTAHPKSTDLTSGQLASTVKLDSSAK